MGFLDRLRGGRADGLRGSAEEDDSAGPVSSSGTTGTAGATAPAVALAAWPGLPPIQRASAVGGTGVADAGFGARLPTWQNPSFTGTGFRAVLDAERSARIAGSSLPAAPVRAVPSLGQPSGELPLAGRALAPQQGSPVAVPLRASARSVSGAVVQRAVPLARSGSVDAGSRGTASVAAVGPAGPVGPVEAVGPASGIRVTAVSSEPARSRSGALTRSSAAAVVQRRLVGLRNSAPVGDVASTGLSRGEVGPSDDPPGPLEVVERLGGVADVVGGGGEAAPRPVVPAVPPLDVVPASPGRSARVGPSTAEPESRLGTQGSAAPVSGNGTDSVQRAITTPETATATPTAPTAPKPPANSAPPHADSPSAAPAQPTTPNASRAPMPVQRAVPVSAPRADGTAQPQPHTPAAPAEPAGSPAEPNPHIRTTHTRTDVPGNGPTPAPTPPPAPEIQRSPARRPSRIPLGAPLATTRQPSTPVLPMPSPATPPRRATHPTPLPHKAIRPPDLRLPRRPLPSSAVHPSALRSPPHPQTRGRSSVRRSHR